MAGPWTQLFCVQTTSLDVSEKVFFFFKMRFTLKSVDFESNRLPSMLWVGLVQSVEGVRRKERPKPPRKGEFCLQMVFGLGM